MPETGRQDLPPSPEAMRPMFSGSGAPVECPEASSAPGPVARSTRSVSPPVPLPGAVSDGLTFAAFDAPAGTRNAPAEEPISSAPSAGSTASEPTSVLGSGVGGGGAPPQGEDGPPPPPPRTSARE